MTALLTGDVDIPILGIAFGTVWDMKLEVGDVQTRQLDVEVVDKMWEIPILQRSPNQNIHNNWFTRKTSLGFIMFFSFDFSELVGNMCYNSISHIFLNYIVRSHST